MAFCPECGRELRSGEDECPYCARRGTGGGRTALPPLDLSDRVGIRDRERPESFPPLFNEEQRKQREAAAQRRAAGAKHGADTAERNARPGKSLFLVLLLVLILAAAAATAVYIILPEIRSSDEAPVLFVSDGTLYMLRGSKPDDVCTVCDLSAQLAVAREKYGTAQAAEEALMDSVSYDQSNEELYFTDLCGGLYRVRINRLGTGNKDIRDRVSLVCSDLRGERGEGCLTGYYSVASGLDSVFYIDGEGRSLCVRKKGKAARELARGVEAYAVSDSGGSVLYLVPNGGQDEEYTMYILPLGDEGRLIKVDSRVAGVERLDSEFDLIWYTRRDGDEGSGPVSVWIGGRSMEKERVLGGADSCCGFSEKGFYYSQSESVSLSVWDYIQDVPETDARYGSYSTIRSVLKHTTAELVQRTVYYWSESGAVRLAENVSDWELLDADRRIISADVCDLGKLGKLSIADVKSAYSAVEHLENAEECRTRYICVGDASFEAADTRYCCANGDGSVLWMIDDSDGRSVLREYTVWENGLKESVKLASDVYAAAYYEGGDTLYYLGDYNDRTMKCDLYAYSGRSPVCISYDVYMPDMEMAVGDGGEAVAYLAEPVFEEGRAVCRLLVRSGEQIRTLSERAERFVFLDTGRVFWIECPQSGDTELVSYGTGPVTIAGGVLTVSSSGSGGTIRFRGSE